MIVRFMDEDGNWFGVNSSHVIEVLPTRTDGDTETFLKLGPNWIVIVKGTVDQTIERLNGKVSCPEQPDISAPPEFWGDLCSMQEADRTSCTRCEMTCHLRAGDYVSPKDGG